MKRWIGRWWPTILMMTLIFIASSMPGKKLPRFGHWDILVKKGGHMTGYALLGLAFLRGLTGGKPADHRHAVLAIICAALYAVTDEVHQQFTPGRSPSVIDVAIDTVGAALGLLVWAIFRKARITTARPEDEALQG